MKKAIAIFWVTFFWLDAGAMNRAPAAIAEQDRIRLAEAFRLADALNGKIWKDWEKAPFAVLLVTADYEFLIRHPEPSSDFFALGQDSLLNSPVFYRNRTQPVHFLATFPVAGPIPVIVIGQAENTASKTSTRWVITLLHEHFHQLQMSQPNYYKDVEALDLSGGDQTGMWMLNYPFPYESPEVKKEFHRLAGLLHDALSAGANPKKYFQERKKLKSLLIEKDHRYASFQLWQEGISRYTEYRVAEWAANKYEPSPAFRSLPDHESFQSVADTIYTEIILKRLRDFDLAHDRRESFYPFGSAEGLLLDRMNHGWRDQYWKKPFQIEEYTE